ncbi:MAG: SDR family oxidoreductase [Rhizobiaceae bacterium]|nr:MAG: SDR family oxidoreductase [Rhizobiaceae bacterium]CAG1013725.1 meso-butanediol dehydrogenase / (S,S)-butanediol dehydrogenase / diacetyl reductase [Rhizobiaceae bacterium]
MAGNLSGRHAIVTGAGSGVGAAIALALAEAGASVTIVGRRLAALEEVARAHMRLIPAAADVTEAASLRQAVAGAVVKSGPVSIVIANAGAAESAPFARMTPELFRATLEVNLTGVFNTFQAGLASMAPGGRLIAIASTAALKGYPYVSAYCAAKHGVIGLVRSLALELASTGTTVNAICPGYTETPMLERTLDNIVARTGRSRAEAEAMLKAGNPQKRFIQPSEIAGTVAWLCSDAAASITGQAISISGGEI